MTAKQTRCHHVRARAEGYSTLHPERSRGIFCCLKKALDRIDYITNYIVIIINHSRSIPKKWQDIARVFEALGDEQRQRIMLSFEKGEELNITQLVDGSRLARTSVAHHLKVLHQAKVLHREKRGKEVYYWINKKFLDQCFTNVTDYLRDYV